MSDLKIAIVGLGLIGQRHVTYVQDKATICGLVDPFEAGRRFAESTGFSWFETLDGLLEAERPDGVILATPNDLHVEQALRCVEAGIPVLIEKPIADKAEKALALVETAERAGVPLLIGHHRRHNALIDRAKKVIDEGRLGNLVTVQAQFWLYKPDDYFDAVWRTKEGAGPTFINLIHDIDLLRYLCGPVAEVQAFESNHQRGFEVEDTGAAILKFANGALGTVTVSDAVSAPWSWEFTSGENPAYPTVETHAYALGGTHASLTIPNLKLWHHPGQRSWWQPIEAETLSYKRNDPLATQIDHFIDIIRGEAEPKVSGREGLKSLQLLEAIKTAALTGQKQVLDAL